jgi:hypothetical protein
MRTVAPKNSDADRTFTVTTEQAVNDSLKQPLTDRVRATNLFEFAWIVRHLKPRKAALLINSHIKKLVWALYRKFVTSENSHIRELGHCDPIGGKLLRPLPCL